MKYIKLGLLISISNINAHCCWPEKIDYAKGVEDELVECFGVPKDNIITREKYGPVVIKATPNKDVKKEQERGPAIANAIMSLYDAFKDKKEKVGMNRFDWTNFQILGKIICNKDVMIITCLDPRVTPSINSNFEKYTGDYKEDVKKKKNIILYFKLYITSETQLNDPNTLNNIELYKKK